MRRLFGSEGNAEWRHLDEDIAAAARRLEQLRKERDTLMRAHTGAKEEPLRSEQSQASRNPYDESESVSQSKPLDGVRVLDLSRILAGPFCTMIMGDLGAEVLKVEKKAGGDDTRSWGPPFVKGESSYFLCVNRNKKSVTIDLRNSKARELLYRLGKRRAALGADGHGV